MEAETTPATERPLLGSFELTLDEKNRLMLPSAFRDILDPGRDGSSDGNGLVVVPGSNGRPWFFPEKFYYGAYLLRRRQELNPSRDENDFALAFYARATRVSWDKQGRMVLPDKALGGVKPHRDVILLGAGNHLELWDRSSWAAYEAELDRKFNYNANGSDGSGRSQAETQVT